MNEQRCLVYGLCLTVPFAVGAELAAPAHAAVDGAVRLGPAPHELPDAVHTYTYSAPAMRVQVNAAGDLLLHTPLARYLVQAGNAVTVDAQPELAPGLLRYMILHYCVPALLIQRGLLALHANALATPRGAVVLSGHSGGGKSTLHAALLARGLAMLSDDVAVLRSGADGVEVLPGLRRYRLVADAWERVQPPAEQMVRLGGPRNKVALVAPVSAYRADPSPLAAIYFIEPYAGDDIVVTRVQGFAAFRLLQTQAYPPLESMALPEHLRSFGAFIDRLAVYRIRRPADRWTVDELVDIVLADDPVAARG